MRRITFVLWIACLVLGFLSLPTLSGAVVEGIPCPPEPTDMFITYGDLVTCSIDPVGDTDVFRFSGITDEKVVVQASRQSGGTPCIELFSPDSTPIGSKVCYYYGAEIDATLDQTGTHTVLVSGQYNNATMEYALALESIVPPSPCAQMIQYGETRNDEINPVGDMDLFKFEGSVGDTITVLASRQSGGTPCIELFSPDGTPIGSKVCYYYGAEIDATLDQTGTHTVLVSGQYNNATMEYALALQCLAWPCIPVTPPDVSGCINLQGSPLSGRKVILKQPLEFNQTKTTDYKGCYKFDSAVSGKKFNVTIKGPVVP